MNICYYISSHGFGHATRSIAIIKELLKKDINLTIRADVPDWLIKNSLTGLKYTYYNNLKTLMVYHDPLSFSLEFDKTMNHFNDYCSNYSQIVKNEIKFCKDHKIDLILSDIEPCAFDAAADLNIPSIGISNFTWVDIFKMINFCITPLTPLKNAYTKASLLFRLPFHFEMDYFSTIVDVPLVSRKLTRSNQQLRDTLNIDEKTIVIFMQFGGHLSNLVNIWTDKLERFHRQNENTVFLINRLMQVQPKPKYDDFLIQIPDNDVETHDYIPLSIVIGKTGYSLVSEVIAYQSPFLYATREGWSEDEYLVHGINEYGIGIHYNAQKFTDAAWIDDIPRAIELKNKKPKRTIKKFGQDVIAHTIIKKF